MDIQGKISQLVNIPVRAWAAGQAVNFVYEPVKGVQRDRGPGRASGGTVGGRAASLNLIHIELIRPSQCPCGLQPDLMHEGLPLKPWAHPARCRF